MEGSRKLTTEHALPPELQRADVLADKIYKSIKVAKGCSQIYVCIRIEEAEELLQLLNDSLKTAKQLLKDSVRA